MSNAAHRMLVFTILAYAAFSAGCAGDAVKLETAHNAAIETNASHAVARLNINTASEAELASLPFIGPKLAGDIVEFRDQHGPFRRPEHLMLIRGVSEKRFRSIQNLIVAE